jgi:hypothetical protein
MILFVLIIFIAVFFFFQSCCRKHKTRGFIYGLIVTKMQFGCRRERLNPKSSFVHRQLIWDAGVSELDMGDRNVMVFCRIPE